MTIFVTEMPFILLRVRPLPVESRQSLPHDVMFASATRDGLGDDVTGTDYKIHNGSANSLVVTAGFQMSIFNQTDSKLTEKLS